MEGKWLRSEIYGTVTFYNTGTNSEESGTRLGIKKIGPYEGHPVTTPIKYYGEPNL